MKIISRASFAKHKGFSLVEVMISIVVLTVGLLMVLALFTKGLSATQFAQQDMIAKQKAREQLEAIFAARNDARVQWNQIQNAPAGIYLTGNNPLYAMVNQSTDIMGTNLHGAGFDSFVSRTGSGAFVPVYLSPPQWQRSVAITNTLDPNLRLVTVTVQVTTPGLGVRIYTVNGEIANAQ
jgi:type IV pilus modification protein PilV